MPLKADAQATDCSEQQKVASVNDTSLHYVECGEGETVLFVHGSTGSLHSLKPYLQLLDDQYRTIAYSRRYHHPNDPPKEGDTYALWQHVDDLVAFIVELELDKVHLVGHSYGGYVSLALAVKHPELVHSLVLGEPPVKPLLALTSVGRAVNNSFEDNVLQPAREAYKTEGNAQGIERFLDGVFYTGWFNELPEQTQDYIILNAGPEHRLELLTPPSKYMPSISCSRLQQFDHPVLLLSGEESPAMFLLILMELEKCLPSESHRMVPGVGHGMFSNISFTANAIRVFLQDQ